MLDTQICAPQGGTMPFTLIKGRFRPEVGIPDGDSLRFAANDNDLWTKLEGRPVKVSTSPKTLGTVQLRLEGIDAIEKKAIQPLATQARESLFSLLGHDAKHAEPDGYILTRMTDDKSRRPIAFAFAGRTKKRDGSQIVLDTALLNDSANLLQMRAGFAYPLYYNTLFADLRDRFTSELEAAKSNELGYWPSDRTQKGVRIKSKADLETIAPIWPKLWRRLETHFRTATSLAGFIDMLEDDNERIDVLDVMEERGLQDLVHVVGDSVSLLEPPENLRVVGQAGKRRR
jgi:endonuclease YncB( thermonuclease family)